MTQLEALIALRDGVRQDVFTPEPGGEVMPSYRLFTKLADFALPQDVSALSVLAHRAYKGSLDAAKALHEAVLPGYGWTAGGGAVRVYKLNGLPNSAHASVTSTPARAWLLAILDALIAQEQDA